MLINIVKSYQTSIYTYSCLELSVNNDDSSDVMIKCNKQNM